VYFAPSDLTRSSFSSLEELTNHLSAQGRGDLQAEKRNTTRPLDQYRLLRGELTLFDQRIPGSEAGTREGRCLFVGEIGWSRDQHVLTDNQNIRRVRPVWCCPGYTAIRSLEAGRHPPRAIVGDDPFAGVEAARAGTKRNHFTHRVGHLGDGECKLRVVVAVVQLA